LILDLTVAEDRVSDNVVDLLIVFVSEIAAGKGKQVIQHHDRWYLVAFFDGFEDAVVGEMNFIAEFIEGKLLMGKAAVPCMILVNNGLAFMTCHEDPLPDIELPLRKFLRLLQDVRIGYISLDNFVLVLLAVFEFVPHVLWIDAVLTQSFDDRNASSS
jgi:hypothetical protein